MSRLRLSLVALLALLVGALGLVSTATAAALPAGPLISFGEMEFLRTKKEAKNDGLIGRIETVAADEGGRQTPIPLSNPRIVPLGAPSWSGDGAQLAFAGGPGKGPTRIYLADADGSHLRRFVAAGDATDPVLSPDGQTFAFERSRIHEPKLNPKDPLKFAAHLYFSSTTWIVPLAGGRAHRITAWGNGHFATPSSFSPDGSLLAISVSVPGKPPRVELIDVTTGRVRATEADATEASFSPDGSRIAFASYRDHGSAPGFDGPVAMAELYVASADFGDAHRITRTPELHESAPSWDPGGDRLAYLRTSYAEDFLGLHAEVVESNADGTCAKVVASPKAEREHADPAIQPPAWVPGEGREAGPLSC